jgi:hypothetical protein
MYPRGNIASQQPLSTHLSRFTQTQQAIQASFAIVANICVDPTLSHHFIQRFLKGWAFFVATAIY